jgi:hypothetical protein
MALSKKETRADIAGIQSDIRKLGEVVIRQATADTRLNAMDDCLAGLDKDIANFVTVKGLSEARAGSTANTIHNPDRMVERLQQH